ncbi:hypothetical protein EYC84_000872 [Monilinia fructicola]|uniref:Required for respiratory growth protein 9, mitochondrial n=1 Tax=Monilinia fructicola TaxID=38448 RepID=A0A5M9JIC0_MONFR|nr:hypothetical protein EYC84_000872 [Monilinia fructicola]
MNSGVSIQPDDEKQSKVSRLKAQRSKLKTQSSRVVVLHHTPLLIDREQPIFEISINVPSVPSVSFLQPSYSRAYSSAYSSQPVKNSDEDAPTESREEPSSATETPLNNAQDDTGDMDDLFMEITPESIDALAAETESELANLNLRESEEPNILNDTNETGKLPWFSKHRCTYLQRKSQGIRALHAQYPEQYTTPALADHFQVSPEAIRRILRTKWVPTPKEEADRERRWFERGKSVWNRYAELGLKPPKRWREEGIGRGKPEWKKRAKPVLTTSRPGNSEGGRRPEIKSLEDEMEDKIF